MTASTTSPNQAVLTPYSHRSPGSATKGVSRHFRSPVSGLGAPVTSCHLFRSTFENQYDNPDVCVSRCWIVGLRDRSRSRGSSPSKPSSSCNSPKAGITEATSWSSARRPCSTSRSAATLVSAFVIEAIRNIVSVVAGAPSPTRKRPAAPSYTTPSLSATIATTPGTTPSAHARSSRSSIVARPPPIDREPTWRRAARPGWRPMRCTGRYSLSPTASRAFFHPSCSTNHSCQTMRPRAENFTAVPPPFSAVFTPLVRP